MYRAGLTLLAAAVMSLGSFPSAAGPTDVVVTVGTPFIPTGALFVPGDDDLVLDADDDGEDDAALELTLEEGQELTYHNLDAVTHTLTSVDFIPQTTTRLFETGDIGAGGEGPVRRAEDLDPGAYRFFCKFHSSTMKGTLKVTSGDGGGGGNPSPY